MTDQRPKILNRRTMHRGRFVQFDEITWRGADGVERVWDSAERVGGREAVLMIPRLQPSNRLVLIRQYRPPLDAFVIEFPAGLIDEGEEPVAAALRELSEETGYRGSVTRITPPTCNSPGLTGETVHQLEIEIDEASPENVAPQPRPEEGEHIAVVLLSMDAAEAFLDREFAKGTHIDSKVVSYLLAHLAAK